MLADLLSSISNFDCYLMHKLKPCHRQFYT